MSRRKGFSLVELLIVLAVIAALIATITPVALNAIRKAQATKVAQNIKTLASAIENAAYVNGIDNSDFIKKSTSGDLTITIADLGRDIDSDNYGVWYRHEGEGRFKVSVFTKESVDFTTSKGVLGDLTTTKPSDYIKGTTPTNPTKLRFATNTDDDVKFGYNFEFIVY